MKSRILFSDNGKTVIKECRTKEECDKELHVYNLKLEHIPELVGKIDERTFEMKRIFGRTLAQDTEFDFQEIGKLFAALHETERINEKVLCHLDTNPRNYIIEERTGQYFFIDFSESGFGYPENDLINFLLFWAAILPTDRFTAGITDLRKGYRLRGVIAEDRIKKMLPEWIEIFDKRRKRYCKNPATVFDWQKRNRELLLNSF